MKYWILSREFLESVVHCLYSAVREWKYSMITRLRTQLQELLQNILDWKMFSTNDLCTWKKHRPPASNTKSLDFKVSDDVAEWCDERCVDDSLLVLRADVNDCPKCMLFYKAGYISVIKVCFSMPHSPFVSSVFAWSCSKPSCVLKYVVGLRDNWRFNTSKITCMVGISYHFQSQSCMVFLFTDWFISVFISSFLSWLSGIGWRSTVALLSSTTLWNFWGLLKSLGDNVQLSSVISSILKGRVILIFVMAVSALNLHLGLVAVNLFYLVGSRTVCF